MLYEDYEPVDLSIPYLPGYLGFRECDAYGRLLRRADDSPHRPQVTSMNVHRADTNFHVFVGHRLH